MNLPQLPTDNLYKYLNVGGLALLLFTLTAYFYTSNRANEAWAKYYYEIDKRNSNFNIYITQKISNERKFDLMKGMIMKKYNLKYFPFSPTETSSISDFKEFYKDFLILEAANIKIEEYAKNIETDRQELKKQEAQTLSISKDWNCYGMWLIILSFIGFIIFLIGGLLWYFKSQKLIDKQLLLEATNPEILKLKIDSANTFNQLLIELYPKKYWEDLDYEDYKNDIATSFTVYVDKLIHFQKKYSIIFNNQMVKGLKELENICDTGKFQVDGNGYPNSNGLDTAEKFIKKMEEMNQKIKENISGYTL